MSQNVQARVFLMGSAGSNELLVQESLVLKKKPTKARLACFQWYRIKSSKMNG